MNTIFVQFVHLVYLQFALKKIKIKMWSFKLGFETPTTLLGHSLRTWDCYNSLKYLGTWRLGLERGTLYNCIYRSWDLWSQNEVSGILEKGWKQGFLD